LTGRSRGSDPAPGRRRRGAAGPAPPHPGGPACRALPQARCERERAGCPRPDAPAPGARM